MQGCAVVERHPHQLRHRPGHVWLSGARPSPRPCPWLGRSTQDHAGRYDTDRLCGVPSGIWGNRCTGSMPLASHASEPARFVTFIRGTHGWQGAGATLPGSLHRTNDTSAAVGPPYRHERMLEGVAGRPWFGGVHHCGARPWEGATAPLPLATDDGPLKSVAHGEGPFVHGRLWRVNHTSRVGWPTQ